MFFLGTESLGFYRLTGPDIGMNFTHGLFRSGLIKSDMWNTSREKKSLRHGPHWKMTKRQNMDKTSDDWICICYTILDEVHIYIPVWKVKGMFLYYRCSLTRVSHHPRSLFSYFQCFIRSEVTFKKPIYFCNFFNILK